MRVLFIVPHPIEGPSSRFRVYQYLPYLRAQGVDVAVRPFMSSTFVQLAFSPGRLLLKTCWFLWSTLRRCVDLMGGRRWDIVYIHRDVFPFGPPIFERLFRRLGCRLVFDFDDAIFLHSRIYANFWDRFKNLEKPAEVTRIAHHVVVGNDYLREYALQYSPNVTTLPTVVDTDLYTPRAQVPAAQTLTIGWIGTPSSARYIEWLTPVLQRVAARPDIRLSCVGIAPFLLPGVPAHFTPWSLANEVTDLKSFDVGVMPLFDDDEARGKCGLKLLQYMAMRIPSIASPVGVNAEILHDNENGLLVSHESEWVEALTQLAADPDLRLRLGTAGRATVEEGYSLQVMAPRLLSILEKVYSHQ